MPGFDTLDFDNIEVFNLLMNGIIAIQPFVNFRGVVYVDQIKDQRITPAASKLLTWLQLFCGSQFLKNITIVTTMWDELNEDGIKDKLRRFDNWRSEDMLGKFLSHQSKVYHHGLVENENGYRTLNVDRQKEERAHRAREMISRCYKSAPDLRLRIFDEMDRGVLPVETSASKWLISGIITSDDEPNNGACPQTADGGL